jgi:hypothetical protein
MLKYKITGEFTKRENIIIEGLTYEQAKIFDEVFFELWETDLEMSIIKKEEKDNEKDN